MPRRGQCQHGHHLKSYLRRLYQHPLIPIIRQGLNQPLTRRCWIKRSRTSFVNMHNEALNGVPGLPSSTKEKIWISYVQTWRRAFDETHGLLSDSENSWIPAERHPRHPHESAAVHLFPNGIQP